MVNDIFDYGYIRNLMNLHIEGKANLGNKLFTILIFQLWYHYCPVKKISKVASY